MPLQFTTPRRKTVAKKKGNPRHEKWLQERIANAIKFSCVTFLGHPLGYDTRYIDTLAEAKKLREVMLEENKKGNFGRGVVVYAIGPDNTTTPVTQEVLDGTLS